MQMKLGVFNKRPSGHPQFCFKSHDVTKVALWVLRDAGRGSLNPKSPEDFARKVGVSSG